MYNLLKSKGHAVSRWFLVRVLSISICKVQVLAPFSKSGQEKEGSVYEGL